LIFIIDKIVASKLVVAVFVIIDKIVAFKIVVGVFVIIDKIGLVLLYYPPQRLIGL